MVTLSGGAAELIADVGSEYGKRERPDEASCRAFPMRCGTEQKGLSLSGRTAQLPGPLMSAPVLPGPTPVPGELMLFWQCRRVARRMFFTIVPPVLSPARISVSSSLL